MATVRSNRLLSLLEAAGRYAVGGVSELGYAASLLGESLYWLVVGPSLSRMASESE